MSEELTKEMEELEESEVTEADKVSKHEGDDSAKKNPDLAKDSAVGRPILPMPITQTRSDFEFNDSATSSILFILIFKLDIDITNACILNLFLLIIIL